MNNRIQQLNDFFNVYASRFNNAINGDIPDIEGTARSFSSCFISAYPLGVTCGTNDVGLRQLCHRVMHFTGILE